MNLAVIPARGGSKRIPRKNIKPFLGRPMIAWSIGAAIESGCFDRLIVSTDDEEIAEIARQSGAEVPFLRPAELADDYATTSDVIRHAISWLDQNDRMPERVCCIYATAPFLRAGDITRGFDLLEEGGADFVFSATSYAFPIQRAIRLTPEGRVEMLMPEQFSTRSQDLDEAYHDAGQFYWGRSEAWLSGKPIFSPLATALILPRYRVQDIDTPDDWLRAELMFKALHEFDAARS
ncbi:pseudaminic acid cytidylyltransferase [Sinorhizobium saheli]|uniref:CMP-N-acetylneuraminic acid synthetase n=1 Tax=Sinorhizobium saheli TaxID=36856 RepID=A0A178YSL1_SINSA|nr:pseudaminic acid cytidylyltransferase [Sinorhizobium saheli]MQW87730.1 pseudaminic acid cytidylyltransferase [Sinorhizobium saheli]OAP50444.1 CMP-N-acetylneuraminic acid synthetase [Sinorhizobium saheli]